MESTHEINTKYNDYIIDYGSLAKTTSDYNIIKDYIEKKISRIQFNEIFKEDLIRIVGNSEGNAKESIIKSIFKLLDK